MGFAKLLIGWALSMVICATLALGQSAVRGKPTSGFLEALLGLGVLLAIPSFLFALIAGWPTMSWLASQRLGWLLPIVAAAVLASIMWVLTKLLLPSGWHGVEHTLVAYAAVLGLVWGCLNLVTASDR